MLKPQKIKNMYLETVLITVVKDNNNNKHRKSNKQTNKPGQIAKAARMKKHKMFRTNNITET